jgi:glycosyltransferase involved in cell wall biosynthesis
VRILYHHRTLGDGAEGIHISEMVNALRQAGHDVHVHGFAASGNVPSRRTWIDTFRRLVPRALFELAAIGGNAVEYLQMRRDIRRFRPHLLYKRHGRNDVGALLAAAHEGVPAAVEINCLYTGAQFERFEPLPFKPLARRLERHALRLARWRFAVSSPLAKEVERLGVGDTLVLSNGADPVVFDPGRVDGAATRARYGLGREPVVGWSGIIRDWHGMDLLLAAVAQLPEARLLIVGDGPGRAAVERAARALAMADRLVITGRVAHDEMPAHIAAMDVAVVADERTGVASPMKLLEYMAMGRAVVAPRLPNVQDVVDDGRTGVLFAPGDAASLAGSIGPLLADRPARAALGGAARDYIVNERTWAHNARRVLDCAGADQSSAAGLSRNER